jgi:hypothetical protein
MSYPYFDPLGETEPHTTPYKLHVLYPPRTFNPIPHLFPSASAATTTAAPARRKTITLKSMYFPSFMRCSHVQGAARECRAGCYVREKGGRSASQRYWRCVSVDCEGHEHVEAGKVRSEGGVACFGKKGVRLVCLCLGEAPEGGK